jgi:protein gp37
MHPSTIEWTEATWNPIRGCVKVSPGCKHCYAEAFAERFRGVPGHPYEHGFDVRLVPHKLADPLRWTRPTTIFVNSMSDLFQEDVPTAYIRMVVDIMLLAPWHTFQVLTKRAARMQALLSGELHDAARAPHIWWGVSVEDKRYGVPRIAHLQATPAEVRFLSLEPLLEDVCPLDLHGIHWVIVGGESGLGARPMQPAWVEAVLQHCEAVQVSFFFKQWGGVRKGKTGRQLHGRTYDAQPARLAVAVPDQATRQVALARVEAWSMTWQTGAKEAPNGTAPRAQQSSRSRNALSLTTSGVA